jgi:hypothetical protein
MKAVLDTLILTTVRTVYLNWNWGSVRVWPVDRGCLLLLRRNPTIDVSRAPYKPEFTVDCSVYLIWTLILSAGFSVYLTGRTDFDCGLFRLPDLDTLILGTDFCVAIWLVAGATGLQEMLTPPRPLIPPLVYS